MARHLLAGLVCMLTLLVVLLSAGQIRLDQLDVLAVHHLFHIVLPVAAFGVFATHVTLDIAKHGFPRFSWRL